MKPEYGMSLTALGTNARCALCRSFSRDYEGDHHVGRAYDAIHQHHLQHHPFGRTAQVWRDEVNRRATIRDIGPVKTHGELMDEFAWRLAPKAPVPFSVEYEQTEDGTVAYARSDNGMITIVGIDPAPSAPPRAVFLSIPRQSGKARAQRQVMDERFMQFLPITARRDAMTYPPPTKKAEKPVPAFKKQTTPELAELDAKIMAASAKAEVHAARRAKLIRQRSKLREVPAPDAEFIAFELELSAWTGGTKVYKYAARRIADRWYVTGSQCPAAGYSWPSLLTFIRSAVSHSEITVLVTHADALVIPDR